MISISIDLPSSGDIEARFHAAVDAINVERVLDDAGAALLNRQKQRFLEQVAPDESPWWPSKAAAERQRTGRDGGTLFDTGTLFHSIQLNSTGPGERAISTDVPYAKFHQFGTSQPHSLRQFLGFNDEDTNVFKKIVEDAISEVTGG